VPQRFPVEVDADQFDALSRPSQPLAAAAELVWNSLDAEADSVDVFVARNDLDGVESVRVVDDGHGMSNTMAIRDFRKLGGSWKKGRKTSLNAKRALHGQQGEGRFRAFALGRRAEWSSVAEAATGGLERTVVLGSMDESEFTVSDPTALATGTTGTSVTVTHPREATNRILADAAPLWLTVRFAPYLAKYPHVRVTFDGTALDPKALIEHEETITLDAALGAEFGPPQVRVVEWKSTVVGVKPSLILCNEDGVSLHEITEGFAAPGTRFTAYLIWRGFDPLAHDLLIGELGHPVLGPIIEAAREAIRDALIDREIKQRQEVLDDWKSRKVYPFADEPTTPAEVRERRMFDLVAITAAEAVSPEPKAAKLSLRLLREALEQSPAALHRVLREVLNLTDEQVEDFDRLLSRTTLPSIIETTAKITDRFEFLTSLDRLLFDADTKKVLRERDQLHEMLAAGRTWVFSEEWALVVSDKSLTKVLKEHLALLGDPAPVLDPVADPDGNVHRRVDLMLSSAQMGPQGRRHLVVELKRPSVKLGQPEINQIQKYAITVAKDERFKDPAVTWEFWLVGNDIDSVAEEMATQENMPIGVVMQRPTYTIRVRRWSEVLEENRQRLHFYRQHLDYTAPEDAALEETLAKYLPPKPSDSPN
jgi:hypothetical protein